MVLYTSSAVLSNLSCLMIFHITVHRMNLPVSADDPEHYNDRWFFLILKVINDLLKCTVRFMDQ